MNADFSIYKKMGKASACPQTVNKNSFSYNLAGKYSVKAHQAGSLKFKAYAAIIFSLGAALFSEADDPAKVAHDLLTSIWKNRRLVTIVTGLTQYENMAIQSLSFPRDQKTGKQLHFRATLKEVRKVVAKTVAIKKVQPSVKHTAPSKADLGNQSATPAPNVNSSLAVKIGNFFGGGN